MKRILLVLSAVSVAGFAVTASAPAAGGLRSHPIAGLGVSISLPAAWQDVSVPATVTPAIAKKLAAADPVAAILSTPAVAKAGIRFIGNEHQRRGKFTANVTLIVEPLGHGLTLRQWFFQGASAAMEGVGTTTPVSIHGAAGLHYQSTRAQKSGTTPLLTDIYGFVRGGRVFMFTYSSFAADAHTYLPTFLTSAQSIRFS